VNRAPLRSRWLALKCHLFRSSLWMKFADDSTVGPRARKQVVAELRRAEHLCGQRFPHDLAEPVRIIGEQVQFALQCHLRPEDVDVSAGRDRLIAESVSRLHLASAMATHAFNRRGIDVPSDAELINDVARKLLEENPVVAALHNWWARNQYGIGEVIGSGVGHVLKALRFAVGVFSGATAMIKTFAMKFFANKGE
jgi:hypothetical protein